MNYDIECRNDLLTGTTIIVKIPEDEIDRKALYTIQTDMPPFIIPFHHYCSDGEALFEYNIGMHCKLQYMTGNRAPKDYAQLWISVLSPLLECTDWFMQPNAFLLDAEYLYYDKDKKSCCFVYIPSIRNISQHTQLKELAADVSKFISVDDATLENKILRAIMKNFDPNDLLQTLRSAIVQSESQDLPEKSARIDSDTQYDSRENTRSPQRYTDLEVTNIADTEIYDDHNSKVSDISIPYASDEIIIEFPENKTREKKKKSKSKEKNVLQEKVKALSNLFEKRGKTVQTQKAPSDYTAQGDRWVFENEPQNAFAKEQNTQSAYTQINFSQSIEEDLGIYVETENPTLNSGETRLRSIGRAELPLFIDVDIEDGEIFSIGKFDTAVGRQQSSFEFDKKMKSISRRHCAIKRVADGYLLVDLASSAGTFVNSERLPPNTAYKLTNGCRVSIGNSGADYIWETM